MVGESDRSAAYLSSSPFHSLETGGGLRAGSKGSLVAVGEDTWWTLGEMSMQGAV